MACLTKNRIPGQSAIEFGIVLSKPPAEIYIEPYLSLNRDDFLLKRFNLSNIATENGDILNGVRDVVWEKQSDTRIIVDDLNPDFRVITGDGEEGLRLAGQTRKGV